MRFVVDNALSWRLAESLRGAGHDAVHVREANLSSAGDAEIFQFAHAHSRIIVTQDVDFGFLLASNASSNVAVVLFRTQSMRIEEQRDRILNFVARFPNELISGTIVVFTDAATRIRRF